MVFEGNGESAPMLVVFIGVGLTTSVDLVAGGTEGESDSPGCVVKSGCSSDTRRRRPSKTSSSLLGDESAWV